MGGVVCVCGGGERWEGEGYVMWGEWGMKGDEGGWEGGMGWCVCECETRMSLT